MAEPDKDPALNSQLPDVEPSDSEEVARSLKLARMLWDEGQRREAVRTLQRGAAAAEEAGDDGRALKLARTAADLATHVDMSSAPPPGNVEEASISIDVPIDVATDEPPSVLPTPSVPPVTPRVGPDTESVSPAAAQGIASGTPSPGPVTASVSPASNGAARSPRVTGSFPPTPRPIKSETPSVPAVQAAVPLERQSTKPVPRVTNGAALSPFEVSAREVRVAVKRSVLDETLFVVRPLAPGAKAPPGAREATLVFSDVDSKD